MSDSPKFPWFPFYTGDWVQGTILMTREEQGSYAWLLCLQWDRGSLPEDLVKANQGYPVSDAVAEKFPVGADGKRRNRRLESERNFKKKQSANGKKGGRKTSQTQAKLKPNSSQKPSQKPSELKARSKPDLSQTPSESQASQSQSQSQTFPKGKVPPLPPPGGFTGGVIWPELEEAMRILSTVFQTAGFRTDPIHLPPDDRSLIPGLADLITAEKAALIANVSAWKDRENVNRTKCKIRARDIVRNIDDIVNFQAPETIKPKRKYEKMPGIPDDDD